MTRLLFLMIKSSDNFYNYFPERFLRNPRAQRPLLGRIPKGHLPPWGQCHLSAKMSQLLTVQTYMAYSISLLLGRWKSHPTSQPPVRIFPLFLLIKKHSWYAMPSGLLWVVERIEFLWTTGRQNVPYQEKFSLIKKRMMQGCRSRHGDQ